MRNKIICAAAAMLTAVCGCTAYANTKTACSAGADGKIEIRLSTDQNSIYTVYAIKPGETVPTDDGSFESDSFAALENIEITFADGEQYANAAAEISLPSDAPRGVYTLVIGGGEVSGSRLYAAVADRTAAASAASELAAAKTAAALDTVLNKYQNTAWALNLTNSAYTAKKNTVLENMIAMIGGKSGVTTKDAAEFFNLACDLADLKDCAESELYDKLLLTEVLSGKDYADIIYENPNGICAAFANLRKDENLRTADELARLVRASKAICALNAATRDSIIGEVESYNDIFALDLSGDYKSVDKYQLAKKLASYTVEYKTLADVRTRFSESVAALAASSKPSGGGSGGSSGGGGGSTGGGGISAPGNSGSGAIADDISKLDSIYSDIKDLSGAEWAAPYIKYISDNKIMQGDGNGYFRPNEYVTREELLKLIIEALKLEKTENTENRFADAEDGEWYAPYVATGVEMGIIKGIDENYFGIGQSVSRQDAAVMLYRALTASGYTLSADAAAEFADGDAIGEYAYDAVCALWGSRILRGYEDGTFLPQNPVSRAEAAKIIYETIKLER